MDQQTTPKLRQEIAEAIFNEAEQLRPSGTVRKRKKSSDLQVVGNILWISARSEIRGRSFDPSTDRLGGDPFTTEVCRHWIGLATNPPTSADVADLDQWATLSTHYVRQNRDTGYWGTHRGSWVENITVDGEVVLRVVSDSHYQDLPPKQATTEERRRL